MVLQRHQHVVHGARPVGHRHHQTRAIVPRGLGRRVPLKDHGVSMSRFESRPARSGQWEYYFYIDVQGHPDEAHVDAALKELRGVCAFFKILGTYPIDVH